MVGDRVEGLEILHAVEGTGIDEDPLAHVGLGHGLDVQRPVWGLDDDDQRQVVLLGEFEVPLIVGGDRHDAAGAVVGQDEVRRIDRHFPPRDGIQTVGVEEDAFLLVVFGGPHLLVLLAGSSPRTPGRPPRTASLGTSSMTRGCSAAISMKVAPKIVSWRVVKTWIAPLPSAIGKGGLAAVALADPVLLHREDPLGPAGKAVAVLQELFDIGGDPEEPLVQVLFADLRAAAPAEAGLHLLVGQDRLALRAPVHRGALLVGEPLFVHPEEEELLPPVVFGLAGRDLPVPVVAEAHPLELALHVVDIFMGPDGGVDAPLDGGVFRRHAEGVPAHRVEDVESLHPLVAGDDVADRVVPDMADVDPAGGVGEHFEEIIFLPGRIFRDLEDLLLFPVLLPLLFNF